MSQAPETLQAVAIGLSLRIEPTAHGVIPDAVSFETGCTRQQASDPDLYVYEHHGDGFSQRDPGALTSFYEDLLLGRPMPITFVVNKVDIDTVLALLLFGQRQLAVAPYMMELVAYVDWIHRYGVSMRAHVPPDVSNFLRFALRYLDGGVGSMVDTGRRIERVLDWFADYARDRILPQGPAEVPEPETLEYGTDGFVVARCIHQDLFEGWTCLFRHGHLKGVLWGPEGQVMLARKGPYVAFDLDVYERLLSAADQKPWARLGSELLLSPPGGTQIPENILLGLVTRSV